MKRPTLTAAGPSAIRAWVVKSASGMTIVCLMIATMQAKCATHDTQPVSRPQSQLEHQQRSPLLRPPQHRRLSLPQRPLPIRHLSQRRRRPPIQQSRPSTRLWCRPPTPPPTPLPSPRPYPPSAPPHSPVPITVMPAHTGAGRAMALHQRHAPSSMVPITLASVRRAMQL